MNRPRTNRSFALLAGLLLSLPAFSAPPPTAAREIDQLIAALGGSGCDFQRNGSWYPAAKAEEHLRRKYEWLREHDKVATAEQFIERAGTQSSMSGRAYSVRCPGKPVVDSAAWLRARLLEMRKANPSPAR
ncbi:YfeK family protein [Lysobacter rhizosphaerae]